MGMTSFSQEQMAAFQPKLTKAHKEALETAGSVTTSKNDEDDASSGSSPTRTSIENSTSDNVPHNVDVNASNNDHHSSASSSPASPGFKHISASSVSRELLRKRVNKRRQRSKPSSKHLPNVAETNATPPKRALTTFEQISRQVHDKVGPAEIRRLAHLDEYQHSSPVPLALFLMIFFIVGMVYLRFTRSSAEPKKRCLKAKTMKTKGRISRSL